MPMRTSAKERQGFPSDAALRFLGLVGLGLLLILTAKPVAAQAPEIPFRLVAGVPCARCTVHYGGKSIAANVVLDIGTRAPLVLHTRTANLLAIEPSSPVEIRFPGFTLKNLPAAAAEIGVLEELTAEHAPELEEIPAVAIVGLPAFSGYVVQMDIDSGLLRLLSLEEGRRQIEEETGSAGDVARPAWTFTYSEEGHGLWLSGRVEGDLDIRVLLKTFHHDTLIDQAVADLAGASGGDVEELRIGKLNIARYVALRPQDLSTIPAPRPGLMIGTNLLKHFRVTMDRRSRRVRFEQVRKPEFPEEERAFFVALADEDADAIESFLSAHAESRLAAEAGDALIHLRLEEFPTHSDALARAAAFRALATPVPRRTMILIAVADELLGGDRDDRFPLGEIVLAEAMKHAPEAADATVAHHIQARLGWIATQRGDLKEARRRLLSASFGLPRDPAMNMWMGELYEKMGKRTRAWSRFLTSAISDEPPEGAMKGLDRLNRDPEFRAGFTMLDAEQLIEGRVPEFHADRRIEETEDAGKAVRLVELFTCLDHPPTQAAELAFGALGEYLADADAALIEYHLDTPATDPLTTEVGRSRAAMYGVEAPPAALFDGGGLVGVGGEEAEAGTVFEAYRAAAVRDPASPSISLEGSLGVSGQVISGRVTLRGMGAGVPASARLHLVLCERAVMVPGGNGLVLHRYVARAGLSPAGGFEISRANAVRPVEFSASLDEVSRSIAAGIEKMETDGKIQFATRPTYIDPRFVSVVAILQDSSDHKVLAARVFRPEEGGKP
jgi:hypothetical protein